METNTKDNHIKYTNIDTILLKVQTDYEFLKDIREIAEKKSASENKEYFGEKKQFIPEIQLEDIHNKALYHAAANILNENNMINEEEGIDLFDQTNQKALCFCGCKKQTGPLLSLTVNEQKIASLGSGVILLFFYLRHLRELVFLCFLTFGIFSVLANYFMASNPIQFCSSYEEQSISYNYCEANTKASFVSIRDSPLIIYYEYILGMVMIFVWIFGIKVIKRLGQLKDEHIDRMLESASDYAVKIDNLPYGNYNEIQLFEYLQFIWLKRIKEQETSRQPKICSIQIVYNMQECRELISKLTNLSLEIVSCLQTLNFKYSNNISPGKIVNYRKAKQEFIETLTKLEHLREQFLINEEARRSMATSIAIIQFQSQEDQKLFLKVMAERSNPIQTALLPHLNAKFKDFSVNFTRSPEPSDILWLNCEKKFNIIRWVFIWGVTIFILYLGYTIVSYTQTLVIFKGVDHIVVTIVLQLLNRLIWFWLSIIITFEQNNTKTEAIISSMKKSIIAQSLNIIVNPIISTFVNNKSLYGSAGLAGMALTYQIVMVFMMLIYYIFNPFYLGKKLLLNIRCLRNIIIKYLLRIVGKIDTAEEIRPVFQFYEGPEVPIAGAYVYMSSAIFHAMFYCHLQPIILIVVTFNMTLFFIIMKYLLYNRCKILQLTNTDVFHSAIFFSSCASAYYAVGSIFFYIIDDSSNFSVTVLIPSIVCLIVWFLSNINICNFFTKITQAIIETVRIYSIAQPECKTEKKIIENRPRISKQIEIQSIDTSSYQRSELKSQKNEELFEKLPKNKKLLNSNFTNKAETISWKRKQSYYANSTTNSLLEFENILKEMKDQSLAERGAKLKEFCEQFRGVLRKKENEPSSCSLKNQQKDKKVKLMPFIKEQGASSFQDRERSFRYTFIPVIKMTKQFQHPGGGIEQQIVYELNKFQILK